MAFFSGKQGFVLMADAVNSDRGIAWAFSKWECNERTKILPRNNFKSLGFDQNLDGFTGADVKLSGPYDTFNPMFVQSGQVYAVALGIEPTGPTLFYLFFRVEKIEIQNDAEDGPMWVVSGPSNGIFDSHVPQAR
jgi:hypothetical protein